MKNFGTLLMMAICVVLLNACSSDYREEGVATSEELCFKSKVVAGAEQDSAFYELNAAIDERVTGFFANKGASPQFLGGLLKRIISAIGSDICCTVTTFCETEDFAKSLMAGGNASLQGFIRNVIIVVREDISYKEDEIISTPLIDLLENPASIEMELSDYINNINLTNKKIDEENIGLWHNALVLTMIKDSLKISDDIMHTSKVAYNVGAKLNDKVSAVCKLDYNYTENSIYELSNEYFETIYDPNPQSICDNILILNKIPQMEKEVKLMKGYFNDLMKCESVEEIHEITDIYLEEMEHSRLYPSSIQRLVMQFNIAKMSSLLWNMIYKELNLDNFYEIS